MRPTAIAALILAIGLVAAACGGDEATPEPTEAVTPEPAATEVADATAAPAGETAEPMATAAADGGTATTEPEATEAAFARSAIHTSDDPADATYGLTSGRYRMEWRTEECQRVDFLVAQADGDFTYERASQSSFATSIINDLPEGEYRFEQRDPGCTEWTVRVDWMTN